MDSFGKMGFTINIKEMSSREKELPMSHTTHVNNKSGPMTN
jgi:hypothetical protein